MKAIFRQPLVLTALAVSVLGSCILGRAAQEPPKPSVSYAAVIARDAAVAYVGEPSPSRSEDSPRQQLIDARNDALLREITVLAKRRK